MELAKEEREETKELLRKLEAIWSKTPVELPAVHLSLDPGHPPELPAPVRARKPRMKTLTKGPSALESDDGSEPMSASQEARRILKLTSPTKGWIDDNDDPNHGDQEEALPEESSSPPTSFLPRPSVGPPQRLQRTAASTVPSPISKPQVGSWITKGASSPSPSPSPAKKARTISYASQSATRQAKASAVTKPAVPASSKNSSSEKPKEKTPRAKKASESKTTRQKEPVTKSSRIGKRRALADSSSEEEGEEQEDVDSVEENDELLEDVAEVVAPEEKWVIKKLLRKDRGLRELYL